MTKIAKLVEVSFTVRVIVNEDATEDQIISATYNKLQDKLDNREVGDNLVSIDDDVECPYIEEFEDAISENVDERITKKMVDNARHYLVADTDEEIREMIRLIYDYEDENEVIDYIDGVLVWEKVTNSFTCGQFIEHIS